MISRIAVAQISSSQDVAKNLTKIIDYIEKAAIKGATMIVFPENCLFCCHDRSVKIPAVKLNGVEVAQVQRAANHFNIEVVLGSIPEEVQGDERVRSTMMLIHPTSPGSSVSPSPTVYRKIHLFDVDLPSGKRVEESKRFIAGDAAVVADSRVARLGLSICYDLRFSRLFEQLVSMGATCIVVAADFFYETGKEHWLPLLRARAIEYQAYVVAANQSGVHADGHRSYGHSMIVDPWGAVVQELDGDVEDIIIADIDNAYVQHIRTNFPALQHRMEFT